MTKTPDFYRAFEDRFRGPRELVKSRLDFYVPLLLSVIEHHNTRKAIDLGCGRGEWLELLTEMGFEAHGSDLDAGMLSDCHDLNLNVTQQDALDALKNTPSNSVVLVSAFHLVEHLPFGRVIELIQQAYRVLVPGGVLIMETPNPENISVGTWSFYLDPTHQRPMPHQLLDFATKFGGFEFTQEIRLNEDPHIGTTKEISLLDVLLRASPDYALIGIKARTDQKSVADVFGDFFTDRTGLSLETLANRFDEKYSGAIRSLDAELFALRSQFISFQDFELKLLQQLSNDIDENTTTSLEKFARAKHTLVSRMDLLDEQMQVHLQRLEAYIEQQLVEKSALDKQLREVYASTSWRLTKPLRGLAKHLRRFKHNIKRNR